MPAAAARTLHASASSMLLDRDGQRGCDAHFVCPAMPVVIHDRVHDAHASAAPQGLSWFAARHRRDEHGDLAHEFLAEDGACQQVRSVEPGALHRTAHACTHAHMHVCPQLAMQGKARRIRALSSGAPANLACVSACNRPLPRIAAVQRQ